MTKTKLYIFSAINTTGKFKFNSNIQFVRNSINFKSFIIWFVAAFSCYYKDLFQYNWQYDQNQIKGLIRFCHFHYKTKSLKLHVIFKEGICHRLKILQCSLVAQKPLCFKSRLSDFVFLAKWQNLIGPLDCWSSCCSCYTCWCSILLYLTLLTATVKFV